MPPLPSHLPPPTGRLEEISNGRQPFLLPGGPRGVLLIHGLTGSPHNYTYLGVRLHQAGYTVMSPLLSGHGGTVADLERSSRADWFASARAAYLELAELCSTVFIVGISMGGLATLRLAREFGDRIRAISILVTPFQLAGWKSKYILPVLQHTPVGRIFRYARSSGVDIADSSLLLPTRQYNKTPMNIYYELKHFMFEEEECLGAVRQPLLAIYSFKDHRADPASAERLLGKIGSAYKELILLYQSYHVITLDRDRELVARSIAAFCDRWS